MFGITFDKHWERETMHREHLSEEELAVKEKDFEKWVFDIMSTLATNHYSKVTFYPYRTALVSDKMFDADRDSMLPLEYMLAIKADVKPDNHTVYEVYNAGQTFYIFCSDGLFRVGKTFKKIRW